MNSCLPNFFNSDRRATELPDEGTQLPVHQNNTDTPDDISPPQSFTCSQFLDEKPTRRLGFPGIVVGTSGIVAAGILHASEVFGDNQTFALLGICTFFAAWGTYTLVTGKVAPCLNAN